MSMLEYNEVVERKYILMEGQPYEVLSSHVFRKQMRKPVNATKLKNLITGKIAEHSFHQAEKIEEADITKREAKYLYTNKGEFWFCEPKDPSKRFKIDEVILGTPAKFLKPNSSVDVLVFTDEDNEDDGGQIIGVKMPIKVELKVTEAPPAVKGDTATSGSKQIVLETGAVINAPLFVNDSDIVVVNTETGEYVERVKK
ncbi:MAG: elongation factor P [bacterium]